MNMVIDATPVPFINPMTKLPDVMPVEMICAYVPYASHLKLEEAAKVAAIRDDEAATNLLLSIKLVDLFVPIPEGVRDELSVEAPMFLR